MIRIGVGYLLRGLFVAVAWLGMLSLEAHAMVVTDILGRQVELKGPAKRVILGDGRFLAVFGVLGVQDPTTHVVGMVDGFRRLDPAGFERYRAAYPAIDAIPIFGHSSAQTVSVEQALLTRPDVAIFGLQGHGPGAHSQYIIDQLEAAGVPTVFIDFRQAPLQNTTRSVAIVGQLLGKEAQAEAFAAFYTAEIAKVTERLRAQPPAQCPSVLIEMRVDTRQSCCITVARGMFADLIEAAGGCNVAKGLLPGAVGELSLEHVIAAAPEVYIGSAIGSRTGPGGRPPSRIVLGAGVDHDTALASLDQVLQRKGVADLPAVRNGRAHALWHHFYSSPLNVYALQQLAQWLHPDLFADLQPEHTLQRLLDGFAPVDLHGTYAVSHR